MELLRRRAKSGGKDGGLDIGPTQVFVSVFPIALSFFLVVGDPLTADTTTVR